MTRDKEVVHQLIGIIWLSLSTQLVDLMQPGSLSLSVYGAKGPRKPILAFSAFKPVPVSDIYSAFLGFMLIC